jgi:hypothetical protein
LQNTELEILNKYGLWNLKKPTQYRQFLYQVITTEFSLGNDVDMMRYEMSQFAVLQLVLFGEHSLLKDLLTNGSISCLALFLKSF